MGSFLLILFILFVIWIATPIFKVWRKVRQFQDEYTRTMNQTQHQQSTGNDDSQSKEKTMADRYRKYSETTAENVDFEELEGKMEEPLGDVSQQQSTRYQEEAISDAEFEEIP